MTPEELKTFGEKVTNGTATQSKKFAFLKALNNLTTSIRKDLRISK